MLKCYRCGKTNNDDSTFCMSCGTSLLDKNNAKYIPGNHIVMQTDPILPLPRSAAEIKSPLTFFDAATLFGFISSIVGCFCIWLIFEPAAMITAIIGFKKGKRYKHLAISAMIISMITFIIQLFTTLYRNNIISEWFMRGIF